MQTLKIKAKKNSSSRTRNRIREHGDLFTLIKTVGFGAIWWDGGSLLVTALSCNASDGKGGKEHWMGWLPMDEIEVEQVD